MHGAEFGMILKTNVALAAIAAAPATIAEVIGQASLVQYTQIETDGSPQILHTNVSVGVTTYSFDFGRLAGAAGGCFVRMAWQRWASLSMIRSSCSLVWASSST